MHDAPTHVYLSGDGPLSHSRLVQRQNVLIARIPLVSTDLLLAFRVDQASKLWLLLHGCLGRFCSNQDLGLARFLCLRADCFGTALHGACLITMRISQALGVDGPFCERDILNLW